MPRKARKLIKGPFYHVMCQGIRKEVIFNTSQDYNKYLLLLKKYGEEFGIEIIAYCVMNNHVHLLIHCNNTNELSKFMHKINLIYAINYNTETERVGHVFRDRYKAEEITDINYLYCCILYIHNNPVKAGICKFPNEYKYSSYSEYAMSQNIINVDILKEIFGEKILKDIVADNDEKNIIFIDVENSREKLIKEIIKNFEIVKNKTLEEILMNYKLRRELFIELHVKNKFSYRSIEKVVKVDRRKVAEYVYGKK